MYGIQGFTNKNVFIFADLKEQNKELKEEMENLKEENEN